ncbi:MAG: putative enzyme related to lactoylglutathione lyase [Planctomycetota bacterium]|jgi:predicted enzyme related to lactoylglutathione lyase
MTVSKNSAVFALLAATLVLGSCKDADTRPQQSQPATENQAPSEEKTVLIQYLEIVTPDLNETCSALEKIHGVSFSEPDPGLGNSRTAALKGGGKIGVRAPMRADEKPVVRPYVLTEDIEASAKAAEDAGAQIAMPPMEIPGHGKFAIYILGGIEHGLWQL